MAIPDNERERQAKQVKRILKEHDLEGNDFAQGEIEWMMEAPLSGELTVDERIPEAERAAKWIKYYQEPK